MKGHINTLSEAGRGEHGSVRFGFWQKPNRKPSIVRFSVFFGSVFGFSVFRFLVFSVFFGFRFFRFGFRIFFRFSVFFCFFPGFSVYNSIFLPFFNWLVKRFGFRSSVFSFRSSSIFSTCQFLIICSKIMFNFLKINLLNIE